MSDTITFVSAFRPEVSFILRPDKSLEIIAEDTEIPKGFMGIENPLVDSVYVKEGNLVKPITELTTSQEPYLFPENFIVYMRF